MPARSIAVEGRWADGVDLGLAVCDVVTPQNIFAAMEILEAAITRRPAATSALGSQGEAEVLLIQVDFDTRPGTQGECGNAKNTVGVVFRPYHLRMALDRVGDNVLPLPRSPLATIFDQVPAPLRVLNPQFGFSQDKAFGTAASLAIGTNLPALGKTATRAGTNGPQHPLDAHLQRVQSTRGAYFRNDADLTYRIKQRGSMLQEYRLPWAGSQLREPLAGGQQAHDADDIGLGLTLKPAQGIRLFLDTNWRTGHDDLTDVSLSPSRAESRRLASRALIEAQVPPGTGFLRAALWHEGAQVDGGATSRASRHRRAMRVNSISARGRPGGSS